MGINWTEWHALDLNTVIPPGTYDLKLNDECGQYLAEIRAQVNVPTVPELDEVLSRNFDRTVYTVSAKVVTAFDHDYVYLLPGDYDELVQLATHGANSGNRAWRVLKNKALFRIVSGARRTV